MRRAVAVRAAGVANVPEVPICRTGVAVVAKVCGMFDVSAK
jgi:hypothetical protein